MGRREKPCGGSVVVLKYGENEWDWNPRRGPGYQMSGWQGKILRVGDEYFNSGIVSTRGVLEWGRRG